MAITREEQIIMSDLKLITVAEAESIMNAAGMWIASTNGLWKSKERAADAVAEYIANQRGLTFYMLRAT